MNIAEALSLLNKFFGEGSVVTANTRPLKVDIISTGSTALDIALDCGGWPRGRLIEIFGPESSGKTTVMIHAMAQTQKKGLKVVFIDVEHAIDTFYAERLGVNVSEMLLAQPSSAEEAIKIAKTFAQADEVGLICIDSVASLATKQQLEGEEGDANIASVARLLSQQLKQLASIASLHNVVVMFSNQLRVKPGVMYGNPEYQPGGNALKFYASIRMRISRESQPNKEDGESVSSKTKIKVVKNKVGRPYKECEFDIVFGKGIDEIGWLFEEAINLGVVSKKGSKYFINAKEVIPLGIGKNESKGNFVKYAAAVKKRILKINESKLPQHGISEESSSPDL